MATDGGATDDAPLFFSDEVADSADIIPKKRLEPLPDTDAGEWKRRYMGTFVLCGYSMTKGDGHAHAGDSVLIQRKAKNKTGNPAAFASMLTMWYASARRAALSWVVFLWMWQAGWPGFLMINSLISRQASSTVRSTSKWAVTFFFKSRLTCIARLFPRASRDNVTSIHRAPRV